MTVVLIALAAIWISGALLTLVHVRRAPLAIEDERGFHIIDDGRAEPAAPVHAFQARRA